VRVNKNRGEPTMSEHTSDSDLDLFNSRFFVSRRQFLEALAATSAGLLLGTPSFAAADFSQRPLQSKVADLLERLRAQGLLASGERTSWCVYDFTAGKKLVSINENSPRQAASMIKPFVAQAFFFQANDSRGRIRYTEDVRETMERSIRRSSNPATNALIDLVSRNRSRSGPRDVEAELKSHAPEIFMQTRVVEKIPADGRTYRNVASAHDYNRFLFSMWLNQLPYSSEMRSLMALPNRDRITSGVESMPDSVRVYDKTGSTAQLCGNMGIIEASTWSGQRVPYTFVGIIERPGGYKSYGPWISKRGNAIRAVSNLVYLHMKDRYRLS
jgi:beta-lactamase class A